MLGEAATGAGAGEPADAPLYLSCLGGLLIAAGVMLPVWVLVLKL